MNYFTLIKLIILRGKNYSTILTIYYLDKPVQDIFLMGVRFQSSPSCGIHSSIPDVLYKGYPRSSSILSLTLLESYSILYKYLSGQIFMSEKLNLYIFTVLIILVSFPRYSFWNILVCYIVPIHLIFS